MQKPEHLFASDIDGNLYDTRNPEWHKREPLRKGFTGHRSHIENTKQLFATLRAGEFTFPGGYRLAFITADGATLSFRAVRDNLYSVIYSIRHNINDGWRVIGLDNVAYSEDPIFCDHTGELLNDVEV